MKRAFSLAALNAVYFGIAAACAGWCVALYGLGTVVSYIAGITACIYGLLAAASLLTLLPSRSTKAVADLRPGTKLFLRATCLTLPVAFFAYVASFYLVQSTYCAPGGVDRFDAFTKLEDNLFHKALCNPNVPDSASTYMTHTFQPWARRQWHGQDEKYSYEVVCAFDLQRDGTIKNLRIARSTGDEKCNRAALVALDAVGPPMPADTPDRCPVEFTFTYNYTKDGWPVIDTKAVTVAQDQFLLEQGKRANYRSDYPRSKQLLLQCLEERRLRFKSGAPEITEALSELAQLQCRMGLLPESHKYFDEAIANALLSKQSHPKALQDTLHEYADQSFQCGKFAKALALYKRCFEINPAALDRIAKIRLAETYYATEDYDSAAKIFAEVIRSDEHSPPADDPNTLDDKRVSLCNQYIKAGHPERAIREIDFYLSQHDGAKNPKSKNNHLEQVCAFLEVYTNLPDKHLAKRYVQSAYDELSTALDPLSSNLRNCRSTLASLLWKSGDHTGATAVFENLVAKYHHETADRAYALFDQASFLFDNKKYAEAESAVREAQKIRMRLYDRNDRRVTNLQYALMTVLEAQHRSQESAEILKTIPIPKSDSSGSLYQVASNYREAGQFEKALEILDAGIRESYKRNPKDEGGERINLLEQATSLCKKLHDDKRLEQCLNETYQSEKKRLGSADRTELIQFYLERNRLVMAEDLANQEVDDCYFRDDKSEWSKERLSTAFLLLAQVKDAEHRHFAAKYYVHRAIEAIEPYGRSKEHIIAVGIVAQILAREGKYKLAERVLTNLYDDELIDTDLSVSGDIVEGFNTTGCYFSSGVSDGTDGPRYDPTLYDKSSSYGSISDVTEFPARVPMIALNWKTAYGNFNDFAFLQASALEARARIQTLESKFEEANESRALLLKNLEPCITKPHYFGRDLRDIENLLKEMPKSDRQQKLLKLVVEKQKPILQ